jgi:Mn-containing catalase
MFSFLLARDIMHQNQWLATKEELQGDGLEETPVPSNLPQERELSEVAYRFMNFSEGQEIREGRGISFGSASALPRLASIHPTHELQRAAREH